MDILLLGIGNKLLARKNGVTLNLVDRRNEVGLLNQSLEVIVCEVGDTNGANLALGKLVYSLPCFAVRNRVINVDLVGIGGSREKVRVRVLARAKVDRPVNEVEIKVVKLELSKCIIESSLNVLRVVLSVPQLRCDEDILTLEAWDILEGTLDAFGDLLLVLVADWCEIY